VSDGIASSERTVSRSSIDAEWADLFPFDPYPQQVDGVEHTLSVCQDDGYLLLEGACGTGKTLIALVAGMQAVAEGDADRVMAVTPVKQQLKQFVTEVQAINDHRTDHGESPIDGLIMVGKRDMLPYAREGTLPDGKGVHEVSSNMRETTASLVSRESRLELAVSSGDLDGRINTCTESECDRLSYGSHECPEHRSERADDEPWYDPVRAAALCHLVRELNGPRLKTAGATAPYPESPPHTRDVLDIYASDELPAGESGYFDPFYARFFADEEWVPFDFDASETNVLDCETIVRAAVSRGTCPHEAMASLMSEADVLVGNYNHAFDPVTRRLTQEKAGVLDDGTLLIVDEAHMLEERVRDLLSDTLSLHALRTAHRDLTLAREYLSGTGGKPGADSRAHARHARSALSEFQGVNENEIRVGQQFIEWLIDTIDREVSSFLHEEYGDWQRRFREGSLPEDDHEIPLRDPEAIETDRITEYARDDSEFAADIWRRIRDIGTAVSAIHENDSQTDRTPVVAGVGTQLFQWGMADKGTYFREIELEYAEKPADTTLPDWASAYNASLSLYNCIPQDPLADIFEDLACGVLMSATLEPFDVYQRVSGLNLLTEEGGDGDREGDGSGDSEYGGENKDDSSRRIETTSYGLSFPQENRTSWIVDLPPFTYRNRGPPTSAYDEMTQTRQAYASAVMTIARSQGNVLLCLPSYAEAEWVVTFLEKHVSKSVLRDRSSESTTTDEMLGQFFQDDGVNRVLVTSARGTVTEGVDYRGDRLHTAAVVGVPYANTANVRMKAVMNAYDHEFDSNGDGSGSGFEYAVQVPAVRKARQALGRVLRGHEEVGTRLFLDQRYRPDAPRSVNEYLSPGEQAEFSTVSPDMLEFALDQFWSDS
jgi:DNA excision repair protein ERCC-2